MTKKTRPGVKISQACVNFPSVCRLPSDQVENMTNLIIVQRYLNSAKVPLHPPSASLMCLQSTRSSLVPDVLLLATLVAVMGLFLFMLSMREDCLRKEQCVEEKGDEEHDAATATSSYSFIGIGSLSEGRETETSEDSWTQYLKEGGSNGAEGECTETSELIGELIEVITSVEDQETTASSSKCTTGSVESSSGSGPVGTSKKSSGDGECLKEDVIKGYQRPTVSSTRRFAGRSPRKTIKLSPSSTAPHTPTANRGHLEECKTSLFLGHAD